MEKHKMTNSLTSFIKASPPLLRRKKNSLVTAMIPLSRLKFIARVCLSTLKKAATNILDISTKRAPLKILYSIPDSE